MTQQGYMLIFSIGPVQSLISQARKTRDLWLGSYLLSKLMEAAMKDIDKNALVFPFDPIIKDHIPDLPNKYIAIVNSEDEARQTAQTSIENMWDTRDPNDIKGKWNDIREDIWQWLFANHPERQAIQVIWNRQTAFEKVFEVYWVAVAEPTVDELMEQPDKIPYQIWLEKAQRTFDARKRLRNFEPLNEGGEKSMISGEREVLHGEGTSRRAIREFWQNLFAPNSFSVKDIDKEGLERLDAVDTIKRFALHSNALAPRTQDAEELIRMDFPSTSSVATASFVQFLFNKLSNEAPESRLRTALKLWLKHTTGELAKMRPHAIWYLHNKAGTDDTCLEILKRDGDCYFDATFESFEQYYPGTTIDVVKAREALKGLLGAVGVRPSAYYALIQMDGDHVGSILGNTKDEKQHRNISSTLSSFARDQVPRIVERKHSGRLVYAGGDDLLAFSPLIGLLKMVDSLQDQYRTTVRHHVSDESKPLVTASMGIAIAHHLTPLSLVRQAALDAEQLAKKRYGRDALVVTILRRSGEQTRVGCHWKYEYETGLTYAKQPRPLFQEFYRLFIEKRLSVSAIHTLLAEVPVLVKLSQEAQQSEIKRVLKRQAASEEALPEQKAQELAWAIVYLAGAMDKAIDAESKEYKGQRDTVRAFELHIDALRAGLVEVFGWLLVMVFLAREEHQLDEAAERIG